jgi:hypothetical protein
MIAQSAAVGSSGIGGLHPYVCLCTPRLSQSEKRNAVLRCDNTNSNAAIANPFLHVSVVSKDQY